MAGTDLAKVVTLQDGRLFASTRDIAELFGKRHDNVIAVARSILKIVGRPEISGGGQNQRVSGWIRTHASWTKKGRERLGFPVTRAGIALLSELVVLRKRCVFATARDIAEVFGKRHDRSIIFQMTEGMVPRGMFQQILAEIAALHPLPPSGRC